MASAALRNNLITRALPDGGFAEHPGGDFRPDATAWCILALSAANGDPRPIAAARRRLEPVQARDGRLCISPDHPEAYWPTAVAVLAWQGSPAHREAQARAVRFILNVSGLHWPRQAGSPLEHDTSIPGWSWVDGAHSWVEPTALSLLALRITGHGSHPRAREATRMLMDRQLPGGGWNYGNTRVYGQELHPMPDTTGLALQALAGCVPHSEVEHSLGYLESIIGRVRTPFSLAWGLLGLGSWDKRPGNAAGLISASLELQRMLGDYPTSHLCLLLLALSATGGLDGLAG